jgi:hypothetical protein
LGYVLGFLEACSDAVRAANKANLKIYAFDECLNLSKKISSENHGCSYLEIYLIAIKILPSKLTPCGIEKNLVILILLHP